MPAFNPPLEIAEIQTIFDGQFVINEAVTAGAQGAVFKVDFQGDAALKVYRESETLRGERECEALERLGSQHVVELFQWGKETIRGEECIFVLTEFIEGDTLDARIAQRPLSEDEGCRLGIDITTGIRELWSPPGRIVHRDIKPKNIMLRCDGAAVLIDLGIARHVDLDTITTWGGWLGTPGYMSPEQARARKTLTFRSDLFSLGIVIYEAMTRQHPFNHRQDFIGNTTPTPIRRLTGCSPEFSIILESMMSVDPIDRPRSCEALISRFKGV